MAYVFYGISSMAYVFYGIYKIFYGIYKILWHIQNTYAMVMAYVFYGISSIIGYLMTNPVYTYISNTWFVSKFCRYPRLNDQTVLFQQFNLLNIWFGLVGFYAIAIIVDYLMPNPVYTYILNTYEL